MLRDLKATKVLEWTFDFSNKHWFVCDDWGVTCCARIDDSSIVHFFWEKDLDPNCYEPDTSPAFEQARKKLPEHATPHYILEFDRLNHIEALFQIWTWYQGQDSKRNFGFYMAGSPVLLRIAKREVNEPSMPVLQQKLNACCTSGSNQYVSHLKFEDIDQMVEDALRAERQATQQVEDLAVEEESTWRKIEERHARLSSSRAEQNDEAPLPSRADDENQEPV